MTRLSRRYSVDNRKVRSLRGGDSILCNSGDVRTVASVQRKGDKNFVRFDGSSTILPMPVGAYVNVIIEN